MLCIENLTKEEYSGEQKNYNLNNLSSSQSALNPTANLELMKNRLAVADYYRLLHGEQHAYWVHYSMRNIGRHLNKYKFNYALKGFLLYVIYRDASNYRYQSNIRFLRMDEQMQYTINIGWSAIMATAAFLYI